MYVIWNRKIWNAGAQTWKPYTGADPHTSHVHISLGWAGALKKTSYWTGIVSGPFPPRAPSRRRSRRPSPRRSRHRRPSRSRTPSLHAPSPSTARRQRLASSRPCSWHGRAQRYLLTARRAAYALRLRRDGRRPRRARCTRADGRWDRHSQCGGRRARLASRSSCWWLDQEGQPADRQGDLPLRPRRDARRRRVLGAPDDGTWDRHSAWESDGSNRGHLDLEVQGDSTRWVTADRKPCATTTHTYVTVLEPQASGPLALRIVDDVYADNSGALPSRWGLHAPGNHALEA